MCSSKARQFLIRYTPKNSHKYGFILYVLSRCLVLLTILRFTQDRRTTMKTRRTVNQILEVRGIALSSIEIRITNCIPSCDHLLSQGVHCVGTVRAEILPNWPPQRRTTKANGKGNICWICFNNFQWGNIYNIMERKQMRKHILNICWQRTGEKSKEILQDHKPHVEVDYPRVVLNTWAGLNCWAVF